MIPFCNKNILQTREKTGATLNCHFSFNDTFCWAFIYFCLKSIQIYSGAVYLQHTELTLSTKISPVVRFISNLLLAGLSGSIPCPVKKYTMFCGRSLSPSDAVTCIWFFFGMCLKWKTSGFVNIFAVNISK